MANSVDTVSLVHELAGFLISNCSDSEWRQGERRTSLKGYIVATDELSLSHRVSSKQNTIAMT